jgi:2-polyprenyl-3-methyl-5-hydroxy-6-metoxy-1,4-benzoquinol methylase
MLGTYRKRFYDDYVTGHSGLLLGGPAVRSLRKQILPHAPIRGRALDVGCGQGELVRLLADRGLATIGIDISEQQVAVAAENGIEVIQADLVDFLRSHPSSFDLITAIDVLEHFDKPDLVHVLDLLYAALASGGTLVARTPNSVSPFGGSFRYGDITHGLSFTAQSIRQLANTAGFERVDVYPEGPVVHGFSSLLRLAAWKVAEAGMKIVLFAERGARAQIVTQNLIFVAKK